MADLPTPELAGRTAVVTGGNRGLGRAIALELALAGAKVVLVARSGEELTQTAKQIDADGGTAIFMEADLGDRDQLDTLIRRLHVEIEAVDILINNAAVVCPIGSSATVDLNQFVAALSVNVVAAVAVSMAVLPVMLTRRWGRIVNVSSGIVARPAAMIGANAYATSKAALEAHTVNLAAEVAGTGVTVNAFRPGMVDTQMQAGVRDQPTDRIGTALSTQFRRVYEEGRLIAPAVSARSLVTRLAGTASGEIWNVSDRPVAPRRPRGHLRWWMQYVNGIMNESR